VLSLSLSPSPRRFTLGCISSSRLYSRKSGKRHHRRVMAYAEIGVGYEFLTRASPDHSRRRDVRDNDDDDDDDDDDDATTMTTTSGRTGGRKRERAKERKKNGEPDDYGKYAIIAGKRERKEER